jgi:hypothetical protein
LIVSRLPILKGVLAAAWRRQGKAWCRLLRIAGKCSLGQRWDTCQLGQQRDVPIDNRKDQRFEGIAASSGKFGTVGTLDRVRGPVGFILAWAVVGASHGKVGSCRPPANLLEPLASTPARSIRVMVLRAVPQYARRIARAFRWHRWGNALAC